MKLANFDMCEFCGDTPTVYFLRGLSTKRIIICCDECADDVRRRNDVIGVITEITMEEAITFEVMRV